MKPKQLIFTILILIAFTSCGTRKVVGVDTKITTASDTLRKETIRIKYDTITIPSDSLTFKVPLKTLSKTPVGVTSKSGRTSGSVRLVNNDIEVKCFTEQYQEIIESQSRLIETLIKQLEIKETKTTVEVKGSPWYIKAAAFIGVCALVFIVFKLLKIFTIL